MSFEADILFSAEIPVDKHFSKKNNWKPGNRRIYSTTSAAEQSLVYSLLERARAVNFGKPIDVPVYLLCVLKQHNFYTKKGKIKKINRRAGDTTNLVQGVEDALQKAGIVLDDAFFTKHLLERCEGPDHISIKILSTVTNNL